MKQSVACRPRVESILNGSCTSEDIKEMAAYILELEAQIRELNKGGLLLRKRNNPKDEEGG